MIGFPAVAAISAAILAYEVLLLRLFAITQWHDFAFMAISMALLGFGVGGALLAAFRTWFLARSAAAFSWCAVLFALTSAGAFLLAQRLPFNALEVVWNPAQLLYLGALYVLLGIPFTSGATGVGLAFMGRSEAIGRVYLWNLVGSGAGALGIVGALMALSPTDCLAVVSGLGFLAALLGEGRRAAGRRMAGIGGLALLGATAWAAAPPSWTELRISEYKGLSRALLAPDAKLLKERSGPLAQLSAVASPIVPFRHAPGLSLQAPALPPPQIGVFVDGDGMTAIDAFDGRPGQPAYLAHATDALAYALMERPEVLVLEAAGGRGVLQAIAHGAAHVDAVEVNVDMIRLVREDFAAFAGGPYDRADVTVHASEGRRFLAASTRAWDLIQLPVGSSGPATGGRELSEGYLHTVEAFALCHRRLRPGGWLSVTGALRLPPTNALKLVATALQAWKSQGAASPADSLVLVRGMTTFTLLMKRGPLDAGEIAAVRSFARSRAFDLAWHPGMAREEANRFNVLDLPEFFDGVRALAGRERDAFLAQYKFDIRPATDDAPYFHNVFKWRTAPELVALRFRGGAPMLELGEIIVAGTLVQALVLSLLLILLPLRLGECRRKRSGITWRIGGYFAALGLAFLFVEIAFIQKFTLFLGHPIYAVAVVLTGFLVFAGCGAGTSSALEQRLRKRPLSAIDAAALGIIAIAAAYLAALPALFEAFADLSDAARVALSLTLIAPLGFLMGMPFPLGLSRVARSDPEFVPWAWGLNGCASVVSAVAAKLLAMHAGFALTVAIALGLYGLAALLFRPWRPGIRIDNVPPR